MYINKIYTKYTKILHWQNKTAIHPKLNNSTWWQFGQDNFYKPFEIKAH